MCNLWFCFIVCFLFEVASEAFLWSGSFYVVGFGWFDDLFVALLISCGWILLLCDCELLLLKESVWVPRDWFFFIWYWCDSICYSNFWSSWFNYFPGFKVGYILLCTYNQNFFFFNPFLTGFWIWGVIFFAVYTRKIFIAVWTVMSDSTTWAASKVSSAWCFGMTKTLTFKTS